MIRFLIPTAKEMKTLNEVPYQKISEKSVAILKEMAKLSTEELSTAYKIIGNVIHRIIIPSL